MLNNNFDFLFLDVSSEYPFGENTKYNNDYLSLEDEIQKISSLNESTINYEKIEELSKKILIENSKDITVACYYAFSLANKDDKRLLSDSLIFLILFIEKYWDFAFPPLYKIKQRTSIIVWFLNKLKRVILKSELKMTLEDKNKFINYFNNLKEILYTKISDNIIFDFNEIVILLETKFQKIEQISNNTNKIKSQNKENLYPENKVEEINPKNFTEKDLFISYQESLQKSKIFLNILFEKGVYSQELFIINRFIIWRNINTKPLSDENITMLISPPEHQIKYLEDLFNNKKWDELLICAENLIDEFVFWLDLHFYVAKALEYLDKKIEQKSVEFCVFNFLEKIGDIKDFKFTNKKTPFASKKTMTWIDNLNKKITSKENITLTSKSLVTLNWPMDEYIQKDTKRIVEYL